MRALFMAFVLAVLSTGAAIAGAVQDCDQSEDPDTRIQGCSLIINGRARGDKAAAYNDRGVALLDKGEYDRAIDDYSRAIELAPEVAAPYKNRAATFYRMGDYGRTVSDASRAISLRPGFAGAYLFRARAYLTTGKVAEAFADISKAMSLDAKDPEIYVARAQIYEARGLRDLAEADYRSALSRSTRSVTERNAQEEARRQLVALAARANPPQAVTVAPQAVAPQLPAPAASAATTPGRRVALVIGNSAYPDVGSLPNPAADARLVADTLRRLGFAEVVERYNLNLPGLSAAIKEFGDKSADADWAVVYYAGHGIEVNGVSYLVPTDAKLLRDTHVADEALPLDRLLDKVESAKKLRLVILDACRNNPFAARMIKTSATRSIGRGLAALEPEGGVLVAYSAKHGTVAQDGDGANSPFATALAAYLDEPGLEINFLFRKVRDRVMKETGGGQEPFLYGSLGAEPLYFASKPAQ